MTFMYPRHFPDLPIFWDDPTWVNESEEFEEMERILEKPINKADNLVYKNEFQNNEDSFIAQYQTTNNARNNSNNTRVNDEMEDGDEEDVMNET